MYELLRLALHVKCCMRSALCDDVLVVRENRSKDAVVFTDLHRRLRSQVLQRLLSSFDNIHAEFHDILLVFSLIPSTHYTIGTMHGIWPAKCCGIFSNKFSMKISEQQLAEWRVVTFV